MVLTPQFRISQTSSKVIIHINVPHVRISGLELTIQSGNEVSFYCRPYLLKLELPGVVHDEDDVIDAKRPRISYDPKVENGLVTVHLTKQREGETFQGLDLLTNLLKAGSIKPRLGTGRYGLGEDFKGIYGFLNGFKDFFGADGFLEEYPDMLELPYPDSTPKETRTKLREMYENHQFSGERFRIDSLFGHEDELYRSAMSFETPWNSVKVNSAVTPIKRRGSHARRGVKSNATRRSLPKLSTHLDDSKNKERLDDSEPSLRTSFNALSISDQESGNNPITSGDPGFARDQSIFSESDSIGNSSSKLTSQQKNDEELTGSPPPDGRFSFASPNDQNRQLATPIPSSPFAFGLASNSELLKNSSSSSTFTFGKTSQESPFASSFVFSPLHQRPQQENSSNSSPFVFGQSREKPEPEGTSFFSEKERRQMVQIGKRDFDLEQENITRATLKIVDVLLAYCYEFRMCQGEYNVESHWTIRKLSATISWLEDWDDIDQVITSFTRRALTFPYLRRWDLVCKSGCDLADMIATGDVRWIVKSLLQVQSLFVSTQSCYILNRLFIDDMICFAQSHQIMEVGRPFLRDVVLPKLQNAFTLVDQIHKAPSALTKWNLDNLLSDETMEEEEVKVAHLLEGQETADLATIAERSSVLYELD